jgi:hypothetical protein
VATDASGNVYVAGSFATAASNGVLSAKIVVYKLDRTNQIVYRFMFGGSSYDAAGGIAVDAKGNVFVVGSTSSPDFPLVHPLIGNPPTTQESRGFISEIDPTGTKLLFSTFMGAEADAVTLDAAGNVYVTGAGWHRKLGRQSRETRLDHRFLGHRGGLVQSIYARWRDCPGAPLCTAPAGLCPARLLAD